MSLVLKPERCMTYYHQFFEKNAFFMQKSQKSIQPVSL
jgi:hypothetical protein